MERPGSPKMPSTMSQQRHHGSVETGGLVALAVLSYHHIYIHIYILFFDISLLILFFSFSGMVI